MKRFLAHIWFGLLCYSLIAVNFAVLKRWDTFTLAILLLALFLGYEWRLRAIPAHAVYFEGPKAKCLCGWEGLLEPGMVEEMQSHARSDEAKKLEVPA